MNNPLRHVGQTARPEETSSTPDDQAGDAGAEARQQNQTDGSPDGTQPQHPKTKDAASDTLPAARPGQKKDIPDLDPGEPPPESSAGS